MGFNMVDHVQFCMIPQVIHERVLDDEIRGFIPPIAAGSCLSGDRGWFLVAVIGHEHLWNNPRG